VIPGPESAIPQSRSKEPSFGIFPNLQATASSLGGPIGAWASATKRVNFKLRPCIAPDPEGNHRSTHNTHVHDQKPVCHAAVLALGPSFPRSGDRLLYRAGLTSFFLAKTTRALAASWVREEVSLINAKSMIVSRLLIMSSGCLSDDPEARDSQPKHLAGEAGA
jgi:hypothetical protein